MTVHMRALAIYRLLNGTKFFFFLRRIILYYIIIILRSSLFLYSVITTATIAAAADRDDSARKILLHVWVCFRQKYLKNPVKNCFFFFYGNQPYIEADMN